MHTKNTHNHTHTHTHTHTYTHTHINIFIHTQAHISTYTYHMDRICLGGFFLPTERRVLRMDSASFCLPNTIPGHKVACQSPSTLFTVENSKCSFLWLSIVTLAGLKASSFWFPESSTLRTVDKWNLPVISKGTIGKSVTKVSEYRPPWFTFPSHYSTREGWMALWVTSSLAASVSLSVVLRMSARFSGHLPNRLASTASRIAGQRCLVRDSWLCGCCHLPPPSSGLSSRVTMTNVPLP